MTAKPDDFDPRFDPAFQRGFAGEPVRPAQARPSVDAAPPIGLPPSAVTAGESARSPSQTADAAAATDQPRRLNPFLVALVIVSVALVAVGVWIIQIARAPFEGGDAAANVDFVFLQTLVALAPAAITLGLATAIGVVFVYAVDWQKRH